MRIMVTVRISNMKRKLTVILLACTALLRCSDAENVAPPNIVLIIIDDMGWKDVGYAGSTFYDTPNIDKLASEGMRFTNAYSTAPLCTPSRGGILSGKFPARTKLTNVFAGPAGPDDRLHAKSKYRGENDQYFEALHRHALPKSEVIIPQVLAKSGYKTGYFGKWHIGECPGYYPDERGFQVAKGYRRVHGVKYGHFGDRWISGNFANLPDPEDSEFIPETLTEETIQFIKENKDEPYFTVLSHYIVHTPITPRKEKVPKYENRKTTDQTDADYAALVESVDESVGQVLDAIKESGQEQNTIVIFTSDNGGLTLRNITSNYPLMGGKSFAFEGGVRVPLIIKWPEKIAPGLSTERVIGTDFYPTLLSAAGLDLMPEQHMDGVDLMPLLTKKEKLNPRPLLFHYPHYTGFSGPYSAIVEDNWKLIRFYNDEEGAYLLYDLLNDPGEVNDLAESNPQKRDFLANRLNVLLKDMDAEMPIKNPDFKYSESKKGLYNLKFTKELAEQQRLHYKELLEK